MEKHLAVVVNEKSVWHDGEAHTLDQWEEILKEHGEQVETLSPFRLSEDNYE